MPRPEASYCEFHEEFRPKIQDWLMKCVTADELKAIYNHPLMPGRIGMPLEILSPSGRPSETIYIGISKRASIKEIEKILMPEIKKRVVGKRIRTDKWKYYLIAYDLRKENYNYSEISEIMYQSYSFNEDNERQKKVNNVDYDVRTVENYYKNALALIAGGYKKYI
jgi:hypothetical protein